MENIKDLQQKMNAEKDNAAKPTANAQKKSAAEINHSGDEDKSRTYLSKGGKDPQGPNFNKKSKGSDGDTGQNAGIFK